MSHGDFETAVRSMQEAFFTPRVEVTEAVGPFEFRHVPLPNVISSVYMVLARATRGTHRHIGTTGPLDRPI